MNAVIEVNHLTHLYGQRLAVDDLTFLANPGEVLGLLGPNGAGKTTMVRLLNGLFHPQSGQMHVLGLDPVTQGDQVRRKTGVLTETPALYERLTARENLTFFATLAGMPSTERSARANELLAFFDLTGRAGDKVGTYSKGMKQRLALARALLARPPLLFLDEPTSGLDPEAAAQVHDLIESIHQHNGQTVVLATHNLYDAQRLCDRVVIMNHGRLLAQGTLDELRRRLAPGVWVQVELWQPIPGFNEASLAQIVGVLDVKQVSIKGLRIQVNEDAIVPQLVTSLVGQGAQILSVTPQQVSLEEIYFSLQNSQQAGTL
jgi:ABC-2 type transport system ATP-binding protein